MRRPAILKLLAFVAACALSAPASAAQCVKIIYKDKNGAVVPFDTPVIGLMLGGKPVMGLGYQAGMTETIGETTPCPKELVDKVRQLFDASCASEQSRKMTASASNVDIARVNQRCGDMAEALLPSKK